MATNTYVALSTQVLTGTVSSVTFSSIPSGYTDLVLVVKDVAAGGGGYTVSLRFNGETSSSTKYSGTYMTGNGSVTATGRGANMTFIDAGYTGGTDATRIIHLMNYSNSSLNKTILSQSFSVSGSQIASYASLWRDTAPINAIYIYSESGNTYSAGSTFALYGIANADNFAKATGGTIAEDSTYTYHVFGATGSFIPKQALTADILVVAGGGGGGAEANGGPTGGGGGAGGLRLIASQSLSSGTTYTCTVGAGGTGAPTSSSSRVNNGNNSSISGTGLTTITSSAGGGGGIYGSSAALNSGAAGGSGGGSSQQGNNNTAVGGAGNTGGYSPVEGYAGGSSPNTLDGVAAGGGGAGGVGANSTNATNAGAGGPGTNTYNSISFASWLAATGLGAYGKLAGGGGGGGREGSPYPGPGIGGVGGGGNGGFAAASAGFPGLGNTGSGGGGSSHGNNRGGNGGSGVIIIRYPK